MRSDCLPFWLYSNPPLTYSLLNHRAAAVVTVVYINSRFRAQLTSLRLLSKAIFSLLFQFVPRAKLTMTIAKGEVVLEESAVRLGWNAQHEDMAEVCFLRSVVEGLAGELEQAKLVKDVVEWLWVLEVLSLLLFSASTRPGQCNFNVARDITSSSETNENYTASGKYNSMSARAFNNKKFCKSSSSSSSSSSWKLIRRPLRGLSGAVQYMHKRVRY